MATKEKKLKVVTTQEPTEAATEAQDQPVAVVPEQPTSVLDRANVVVMSEEQPAPPPQEPVTIADVIELQHQLNAKRGQAIKQLLQEIDEKRAQLRLLGYEEEGPAPRPARAPRKAAPPSSEGASSAGKGPYCKYCDAYGHDARAHRGQAVKRKFTPAEIAALK